MINIISRREAILTLIIGLASIAATYLLVYSGGDLVHRDRAAMLKNRSSYDLCRYIPNLFYAGYIHCCNMTNSILHSCKDYIMLHKDGQVYFKHVPPTWQ